MSAMGASQRKSPPKRACLIVCRYVSAIRVAVEGRPKAAIKSRVAAAVWPRAVVGHTSAAIAARPAVAPAVVHLVAPTREAVEQAAPKALLLLRQLRPIRHIHQAGIVRLAGLIRRACDANRPLSRVGHDVLRHGRLLGLVRHLRFGEPG